MQNFLIKSAKLISEPKKTTGLISGFLLDIPNGNGSIFSLVKILGKSDDKRKNIIRIIGEHLTQFHETIDNNANIPRRFEQILQVINDDISEHIKNSATISLSDFHAVLGIVHKNQIFISGIGNLSALFMHQTGKKRFVIYELEKQFDKTEDLSWEKPFLTVLDGELHPGDIFYCASKIAPREMNLNELQDILATLPPSGALKRIHQHISFGSLYGGIIFKMTQEEKTGPPKKINPISSMKEWGKTKDNTATILGEQKPDLKSLVEKFSGPLVKKLSSPGSTGYKSSIKSFLSILIKFTALLLILIWSFIKKIWQIIKKITISIYKTVTDDAKQKKIKNTIKSIINRIKTIPKTGKYIIIGAAATILLLIGSMILVQSRSERKQINEDFASRIETIEEKADGAEASLIYDDKNQSRILLDEAVGILDSLIANSKSQEDQINEISNRLNDIYYKLRGVTESTPIKLASINTGTITSIVEADGVIYAISENEIYKISEPELSFDLIDLTSGSVGMPEIATGQGGNFIFIDDSQNLGKFTIENNTINPIISGIKNQNSADDLVLYNDNLYVLSAVDEQILKMRPQGTGFDGGTDWIQIKNTDLSRARGISIDGDIYILTNNDIVRFTSGREIDFNLDTVQPELKNPTEFWTTIGTEYIYILEADEARIVVFNKNGSLEAQYVTEELRSANGMIVRESDNSILFSTDSSVYSITAEHLLQ